jgi:hypothetical protein
VRQFKFNEKVRQATIVIPADAGIQHSSRFLDSGSRQPEADLAGMTVVG